MSNFRAVRTRAAGDSPGQQQLDGVAREVNRHSRLEGAPLVQTLYDELTEDLSLTSGSIQIIAAVRITTSGGRLWVQAHLAGTLAGYVRLILDRNVVGDSPVGTTITRSLARMFQVQPGSHLVQLEVEAFGTMTINAKSGSGHFANLLVQEIN